MVFKRMLYMLLFLLCGVTFFACNSEKKKESPYNKESLSSLLVYPTEVTDAFCLDDEGFLYTIESGSICVYAPDGTKTKTIAIQEKKYHSLCVSKDTLYASYSEADSAVGLFVTEISLKDGKSQVIYENSLGWNSCGMENESGRVIYLEKNITDAENTVQDFDVNYYGGGEHLQCFDLSSQQITELPIENVICFFRKDEKTFFVFAYDTENMELYLGEAEATTGKIKKKYELNRDILAHISAMCYDKELGQIIFYDFGKKSFLSFYPEEVSAQTSFFTESGLTQIENGSDLKCQNGFTYFLSDGKVTRLKNDQYIKSKAPLTILSENTQYTLPNGLGYALNNKVKTTEELATVLMAGDEDYDLLLISTNSSLAEQIRRTGAYAPLNDVGTTSEYLAGCFDNISNAATAKNGEIWMFPYEVDCRLIVFREELCEKCGFDFTKEISYEDLFQAEEVFTENRIYNSLNKLQLIDMMLKKYLNDYVEKDKTASFDTPLFQNLAIQMKTAYEEAKNSVKSAYNRLILPSAYSSSKNFNDLTEAEKEEEKEKEALHYCQFFENVAITIADNFVLLSEYGTYQSGYSLGDYDFSVRALPPLDDGGETESLSSAYFLVLNPKSKNLAAAKEYIAALAEYYVGHESLSRTKELRESYTETELLAHEVYREAKIYFELPSDIIADEFFRYLRGEKTLREVIPELERKLNAYWRE